MATPPPRNQHRIRVTGRFLFPLLITAVLFLVILGSIVLVTQPQSLRPPVRDKGYQPAGSLSKSIEIAPVAASQNYRNELVRTDFVPAEPNHYWCDLGQTYLKHQNYQPAIDSFNKALEVETEPLHRAEILYFLGASYQYNNNPAQAKTSFQNSLTLYESVIDKLPLSVPLDGTGLPASEQAAIKTRLAELYKVTGRNSEGKK